MAGAETLFRFALAKGRFATRNSHINYFIDVTAQKYSLKPIDAVVNTFGFFKI